MTEDIEVLTKIIQICLYVAAFFVTAFPVLYAFSPWYSTKLGRLLMLQAIAFASAVDLTALFQFWQPKSVLVYFWIETLTFIFIAIASGLLTWGLWRTNHSKWTIHSSEQEE